MPTTGDDPTEIRNRIEDLYAFPPARRDLSSLVRSLPKRMWAPMGRWHGAGTWAKYFDNPADGIDLEFAGWQVIDLAGAAEHEDLCEAAMFYLLERLRIALEDPTDIARVKLMVVDEAWRYLKDPAVLSYLAEAAKTWRKKKRRPDHGDTERRGRDRDARRRRAARIHAHQDFSGEPESPRKGRGDIPAQSRRNGHDPISRSKDGALPEARGPLPRFSGLKWIGRVTGSIHRTPVIPNGARR